MHLRAHELIREGLDVYAEVRDAVVSSMDGTKSLDPDVMNFLRAQLHFLGERSQSVFLLLDNGRLWDAEIVLRAAAEATLKCLFLLSSEPAERAKRLEEFWSVLGVAADIRSSDRAKLALQVQQHAENRRIFEGLILSSEEVEELNRRHPPRERRRVAQAWSFVEMVRAIASTAGPATGGEALLALLHNYGLSSHLIHADQQAMSLVWDRLSRGEQERALLEVAQVARIVSDSLSFVTTIGLVVSKLCDSEESGMMAATARVLTFFDTVAHAQMPFHETQKKFYERLLQRPPGPPRGVGERRQDK